MKTKRKPRKSNRNVRDAVISSLLFLLAFGWISPKVQAQSTENAFLAGEKLTYGAYYHWHLLWVNAGEVIFTTDTIQHNKNKQWHFLATGKTFKAYDLFYTVRDTFESRVNFVDFTPDYFIRKVNHGKSSTLHEYTFNSDENKISSYIKRENAKPFRDELIWKPSTADMLSTVYAFRNYNFEQLKKGKQVNFRMLVDNKTEDLYFRYEGQEQVKTRNGRKFNCHHVVIKLLGGDFFPDGEHMDVWFTADRNRIPIKVETKIVVGSVNAILTDLEHIKYPLTSEIK